MGALPRGHKVKPLVSEFGSYMAALTDPQRPELLDAFLAKQPKGARIVSRRMVKRGMLQAASVHETHPENPQESHTIFLVDVKDFEVVEKVFIGIPSQPDDFIQRAIAAGHPRSLEQYVDPKITEMLHANFVGEPADIAQIRISFFRKYLQRAKELSSEEEKLRSEMPPM